MMIFKYFSVQNLSSSKNDRIQQMKEYISICENLSALPTGRQATKAGTHNLRAKIKRQDVVKQLFGEITRLSRPPCLQNQN